jgi:hypothetical protein
MKRATVLEDFCQIDGLSSTEHTWLKTNTLHFSERVYLMCAINYTSQSISFDALQNLQSLLCNSTLLFFTYSKPSSTDKSHVCLHNQTVKYTKQIW